MAEVKNELLNGVKEQEMITPKVVSELLGEALNSADNLGANLIHGVVKTIKDNKVAVGIGIAGLIGNGIAKAFDLDNPLAVIGQENLGLDAFVDNAADLALLGAGAKLATILYLMQKMQFTIHYLMKSY